MISFKNYLKEEIMQVTKEDLKNYINKYKIHSGVPTLNQIIDGNFKLGGDDSCYRKLPRKPRMLASGMNWQHIFKNHLTNSKYDSILYM